MVGRERGRGSGLCVNRLTYSRFCVCLSSRLQDILIIAVSRDALRVDDDASKVPFIASKILGSQLHWSNPAPPRAGRSADNMFSSLQCRSFYPSTRYPARRYEQSQDFNITNSERSNIPNHSQLNTLTAVSHANDLLAPKLLNVIRSRRSGGVISSQNQRIA